MTASEVKAHVASLLDVPLSSIILRCDKSKVPSFEFKGDYFVITYKDEKTLVHEFLHSCFTPNIKCKNHLFNAMEDYRISIKAGLYDKKLAEANDTIFDDATYKRITENVKDPDELIKQTYQICSLMATPQHVDIKPTMEKIGLDKVIQDQVLKAREELKGDPTIQELQCQYNDLVKFCKFKDNSQGRPITSYSEARESAELDPKEEAKEKLKRKIHSYKPSLNRKEEFLLEKAIRKIIQNKSIGKRRYTLSGKLKTRRLGRMPSNYIFQKKTSPQPETKLYVLGDASGSMWKDKMEITLSFFNSLRRMNIENFKLELRMFNSIMFKNEEIPEDFHLFERSLMSQNYYRKTARSSSSCCSFNDDAHFLKEIVEEILNDPTPNKALLILSDGEPAPTGDYEERDLEHIARTVLDKSGIPYMSIGIKSESVKKYYSRFRICNNTSHLIDTLYQNTKMLIKK